MTTITTATYPATSSYLNTPNSLLTVQGKTIAYRELGHEHSGTPLVLLVHLAATLDNWDPKLIDLIASSRRVILLDLPGVGASEGRVAGSIPGMAQDVLAILHALGVRTIDLLGLSMGGFVAQEVVRAVASASDSNEDSSEYSLTIEHLILVGTGPRDGEGIRAVARTTFSFMLRAALNREDPKRYIFYTLDSQGKDAAHAVLGRLSQRTSAYADKAMAPLSFLRQLRAITRWSKTGPDDLSFITMPTLLVNGDTDIMVPTANTHQLHERIAHSEMIIYPHAAHGSLFQYPEEFSQSLESFLSA